MNPLMQLAIAPLKMNFESAKVLVVGDVMLDRYWEGDTSRISPEAPVPVIAVESVQDRLGGAANVALNVSSLGAQATLLGVIGSDEAGDCVQALLAAGSIKNELIVKPTRTITKLRVIGRHQQLLRCDFEENFSLFHPQLIDKFKSLLSKSDIIILSDYAKGTLKQASQFIELAQQMNKPVFVDPKSNDFSTYSGAFMITPNFKEFMQAVGHCADEASIERSAMEVMERCRIDNVLVTRGAKGMSLFAQDKPAWTIPTQAQEVFDVTGAGDTVIAVLATAIAVGHPLTVSASIANLAAGLVIKHLGTVPVTHQDLVQAVKELQDPPEDLKVLDEEQAVKAIHQSKAKGERIVMTNGCFDVLHAGHVTYLKQAKRLGHRLIIAVNNDESVKRLKGQSRPINTLEHRMQVLASLECVDWVMPFAEDTPQRVIEKLLPDVLVKGGDYTKETIVGAQAVEDNGGQVVVIELVPGLSTTRTLSKMNPTQETVE